MDIRKVSLVVTAVVLLIGVVATSHRVRSLDKQMSIVTDLLREQQGINKSLIEALKLREDPQYLKEVTDCNTQSIKPKAKRRK